jgi:hypothetical protein
MKSILFIFGGEFGCFWFVWLYRKMLECLTTIDLQYNRKTVGNLPAEIYSLRNQYIIYQISQNTFCLRIPTLEELRISWFHRCENYIANLIQYIFVK